jgi:hypothetical protein
MAPLLGKGKSSTEVTDRFKPASVPWAVKCQIKHQLAAVSALAARLR